MATNPAVDVHLESAEELVTHLLAHVEGGDRANDLQLVAVTAQVLATVALVHAVTDLTQVVIREA